MHGALHAGRVRLSPISPSTSRQISNLLAPSRASNNKQEQDAVQHEAAFSFPDHIPEVTKQQSLRVRDACNQGGVAAGM